MMNSIYFQTISKSINLNSYSTSENWFGYFERNGGYSKRIVNKTISIFLDYFKEDLSNFVIASSYYIDKNKLNDESEKNIYKDVLNAEKKLIEKHLISVFDFSNYFNYEEDNIFELQVNKLEKEFKFIKGTPTLIKDISLIAMCDSNMSYQDGHCFFISLVKNIIVYPHSEETGFGCLIIDEKKESAAKDFLSSIRLKNDYNVFIKVSNEIKKL
ncbi:hypothetical protein FLBR109950_15805 [Flavobacterium branchiophilum]|uniref:Uncharacterized protein n=1 Tax=Flavobacterium branchiophilum (strain FL-15) TaxID=1034807 RepID=G2Z2Z9_FLABF|nr:hypothetical protein [Flavobacterium branchiophilum]CCB70334.1 Hypothetical protein FBFL15_2314 [Flavobacterium branchiophilum FL-15]